MALNARQTILYKHLVDVYRTTRNAVGDHVYSKVLTAVPCYHYSTPNLDVEEAGGFQFKQNNIFTADHLKFETSQDIRAEDNVTFVDSGFDHTGSWFVVMGDKQTRSAVGHRRTNDALVYLNPCAAPRTS